MAASGSHLAPDDMGGARQSGERSREGSAPRPLAQSGAHPLTRSRLKRFLQGELSHFHPWKTLSLVLVRLLPQQCFNYVRTLIVRAAGVRIGPRTRILGPLKLTGQCGAALLSIGSECVIGGPVHIDLGAEVEIGDRVHIGHHVLMHTVDHLIGSSIERCGEHVRGPIAIGSGAWIGSNVTILPGVRVGSGAVVAAGALVERDVPDNTLVGGVPARKIRDLEG